MYALTEFYVLWIKSIHLANDIYYDCWLTTLLLLCCLSRADVESKLLRGTILLYK